MSFSVISWATRLFQPSLVRRVVLALAGAFLLVFLVLLVREYFSFTSSQTRQAALKSSAEAIADSLTTDTPMLVDALMQAVEVQYRTLRRNGFQQFAMEYPGDMLFQVTRPDGTVLYASPSLVGSMTIQSATNSFQIVLQGRTYWRVIHETTKWRIILLEPVVRDSALLSVLVGRMLIPMLIAFPIILLPIWFAVRRGLMPLRQLTEQVTGRSTQDFSPLEIDLPYAELRPLVRTFNELFARSRLGIARERAIVQDAAHELRTPLAVVSTQAHRLLNSHDDEDKQAAKQALDHSIRRASHMTHQLFTLATLEGREASTAEESDLVELIRQVVISFTDRAEEKEIEITLESPDKLVVSVDIHAFLSILENLIVNAINYGKHCGRIVISLSRKDGQVALSVSDNGVGISEAELPHLFERFYRGRSAEASGAGLGLAIVMQAVQHIKGRIEVDRGLENVGVSFNVAFPSGL